MLICFVVLYKKGPPFYHASYSVLVTMIDEHSSNELADKRFWNWGAVTGKNRITENVAKVKITECNVSFLLFSLDTCPIFKV